MKSKITKVQYEEAVDQARVAKLILNNKDFKFFREYLENALNSSKESILTNSIHDVTEEITLSDRMKKLFHIPKKEQVDEVVGVYKFVKKLFEDLNYFASMKEDLDTRIAKGQVILDGGNKKDVTYVGQR